MGVYAISNRRYHQHTYPLISIPPTPARMLGLSIRQPRRSSDEADNHEENERQTTNVNGAYTHYDGPTVKTTEAPRRTDSPSTSADMHTVMAYTRRAAI